MPKAATAVKHFTITSSSQVRGPRACTCGCGGNPRHRVKVEMAEWEEDQGIPVLWATKLSAGEKDRHRVSLEEFDEKLGIFVRHPEWERSHWLAACLRDHQNHRIWEDLPEARRQLEELDDDEVTKLVIACNEAQIRPGRAEGNAADPSKTTISDKPSGTSPSEPDTSAPVDSSTT